MPIVAGDIHHRHSGGAGNSDPNASLGGVKSSTQITDATVENLFANVTGAQAAAGVTHYRCYYIHNNHGSLTLESAKTWIETQTPSTDTVIAMGLDPAGVGNGSTTGVATTIANEDTAPAGVTFSEPSNEATGLVIGNIPTQQSIGNWLRRTVTAGASAFNNDSAVLRTRGDTAA